MQKELSVGEVAKRSGVAVSALHFYEQRGLIRSNRTRGNQRRYGRDVLRRIAVIRIAQEVGIPLARGSVNYLLGRLDPAIAAYREALALEARPEIHLNLGRALRAQGLLAEAERELARAVRLDPRLAAEAAR